MIKGVLEGRVYSPAKVADLQHIEVIKDVLRFDITMDDVIAVQVTHSTNYLSEVK
jgi:hypothetical protein